MESFVQEGGVTFAKPAETKELVKKSVSAQDAYSYAHAPDKNRWNSSRYMKQREINRASVDKGKANRDAESNNAAFYRGVENVKGAFSRNRGEDASSGKSLGKRNLVRNSVKNKRDSGKRKERK